MKTLKIGEILISQGILTEQKLQEAILLQKNEGSNKRLGEIIVDSGMVSEDQVLGALSKQLDIRLIDLSGFPIEVAAVAKIPKHVAAKYNAIAIAIQDGALTVAVCDPLDLYALEDIKLIVGMPFVVVLARKGDIQNAIRLWYAEIDTKKAAFIANQAVIDIEGAEIEDLSGSADDTPVVALVNSILSKAQHAGASDVHIEPFEDKTIMRIRVDGQILEFLTLSKALHNSILTRIKILAALDIAEKRLPQDGHFRAKQNNLEMNVRVSTFPTIYGEKAVLRFLNQTTVMDNSETFGMIQEEYDKLIDILRSPHGILYITGPTGCGKTTTLYMILEMLAKRDVNISTIEDPVERNISRINQAQTNLQAGFTFQVGLRSMLRQDPDIIMVGETRDSETASITISAALTGHLVLSTLHTNDAVSAIVRLNDMGIEEYMIANSLTGVVAQRLAKKICPNCRQPYAPPDSEKKALGVNVAKLYKGGGCNHCNYTGYKGRVAIHEVLQVDQNVRNLISRKEPIERIYTYLKENNKMTTLKQAMQKLVLDGVSSVEEFLKLVYFE